jgi:Ca2+-binding RTX toxin-like protein
MDFDPREDVIAIQVTDATHITPGYDEQGAILTLSEDGDLVAKIHLSDAVVDILAAQGFTASGLLTDVMEHMMATYDGDTFTSGMLENWGLSASQSNILDGAYDSDTNLLLIGAWLPLQTAPDDSATTWGTHFDDVLRAEKGEGGNDVLTGGAGSDIFYFNAGNDMITDFSAGERIYVQLAGIDLASEVRVNGDVYTFAGYDGATTSLTVNGEEPISIYYDSSASALVMAA